jgi:membrane protein implicated in regulation of membrane protease activity
VNSGNTPPQSRPEDPGVPPTDKGKMALAAVLLLIPIVVLLWVPHYTRVEPTLLGFPFFFWYQFLWVFICSALTWTAYKLTLSARGKTTHKVGEDR